MNVFSFETKPSYKLLDYEIIPNFKLALEDNKIGVYDIKQNKIIVPIIYDTIVKGNDAYLITKKGTKKGIVDAQKGLNVAQAQFDDVIFPKSGIRDDFYVVNKNKKFLYAYNSNKLIDFDSYEIVQGTYETKNKMTYFYPKDKNEKIEMGTKGEIEHEKIIIFKKKNKKGVMIDGKIITPAIYDSIELASGLNKFIVKKGNKKGVINLKEEIIPIDYDDIKSQNFCFVLTKNNKKALFCKKIETEFEFDSIKNIEKFDNRDWKEFDFRYLSYFVTYKNNKKGLLANVCRGHKGCKVSEFLKPEYDEIKRFENKIIAKKDDKYAIFSVIKNKKPKFIYDDVEVTNYETINMLKTKRKGLSYVNEPKKVLKTIIVAPCYAVMQGSAWVIWKVLQ